MKNFYMTLGSGQPYYPGYFICEAENESKARELTSKTLNNQWCGTYYSLEEVYPNDRVYRGTIKEATNESFK